MFFKIVCFKILYIYPSFTYIDCISTLYLIFWNRFHATLLCIRFNVILYLPLGWYLGNNLKKCYFLSFKKHDAHICLYMHRFNCIQITTSTAAFHIKSL